MVHRPQFITGDSTAFQSPPPVSIAVGGPGGLVRNCELTVYNQGMGLVKDHRMLHLKSGRQTVEVDNVAAQIDPTSVGVESVGTNKAFELLEQNYQYDLISPLAILAKSVGQPIRFIRTVAEKRDVLDGTLISAPTTIVASPNFGEQTTFNGMVIRSDDGRIVLNPTGEIEVKAVPPGMISRPTLLWDLEAAKAGDVPVEVNYITHGLMWNADYVLTLDASGAPASMPAALQGWVTVNNTSGATYENAKLKLLAGDVHVAPTAMLNTVSGARSGGFGGAGRPFQEEQLFEYHLYTLQRPATVRDKETKQLSLLDSPKLTVTKRLIIDASMDYGRYFPSEGEVGTGNIKPQVRIEFLNTAANGMGMPLPQGRFRIYQRDRSGSVQLLGEDNIQHTPRDEKVSLVVGHAFDIVANRKRTNFVRIGSNSVRESFEIEVRNRKDTPETVDVIERHYGDWRILDHSMEFTKTSAESVLFRADLRANEVRKISYTVETRS
jgi:hypothetical protein